jgi:hypothetical protein
MNVTRTSHVKVLGRMVRVPNWFIVDRKWDAAKIARVEQQAQALGDLQNFVVKSPLFPVACVAAFFGFMYFVCWAVPALVDTLL